MGTLLPYALRGTPALEVSLPVRMADLGTVRNGEIDASGFAEYVRLFGDVFAEERARIGRQVFGDRAGTSAPPSIALVPDAPAPRNYIISAALTILADGKTHDADDILAQGLARGILPTSTTRKYVYTALHEYVVRTLGAGRVPAFVQIAESATFRINAPPIRGRTSHLQRFHVGRATRHRQLERSARDDGRRRRSGGVRNRRVRRRFERSDSKRRTSTETGSPTAS